MALARYHGDGSLDTGFGTDGKLTADFHGKGEFGQDVAIQADGKIVAAGYTANGLDTEFALMRINPWVQLRTVGSRRCITAGARDLYQRGSVFHRWWRKNGGTWHRYGGRTL
jgi:hypothetical protein